MAKRLLLFGVNGALGRSVAQSFTAAGWGIFGVDVTGPIHAGYTLQPSADLDQQLKSVLEATTAQSFDAVINVAGGWAGGHISDDSIAKATDLMIRQSLHSSIISGHVASKRAKEGSLIVFTGAAAAVQPTPGMVGYGVAKAAVHHLAASMVADSQSLPKNASVVVIAPKTLDTPGNRQGMPGADFGSWTPTAHVAEDLLKWATKTAAIPHGRIVSWDTKAGVSTRIELKEGGKL